MTHGYPRWCAQTQTVPSATLGGEQSRRADPLEDPVVDGFYVVKVRGL